MKQELQGVVSHGSWLILGWYICPSGLDLFTKFLKSRFKVYVENLQFWITLWMTWGRKDVVNTQVLENIVH